MKATYSPSLGDAYAVAAAKDPDNEQNVTLLARANVDYDVFEDEKECKHLIKRFRDDPA